MDRIKCWRHLQHQSTKEGHGNLKGFGNAEYMGAKSNSFQHRSPASRRFWRWPRLTGRPSVLIPFLLIFYLFSVLGFHTFCFKKLSRPEKKEY